jgi:ankyrin repeat protein
LATAAFNGKVPAIAMSIDLGAGVNAYNIGSHPHATALHNAVCSGSLEAVKLLVEHGAEVDKKDTAYQATPLDWAEYYVREQQRYQSTKQYVEIVGYLRNLMP